MKPLYDVVVIGGGFAGISAAIYTTRLNRSTIVLDNGTGRWNSQEVNQNYLGFPQGISSQELRRRGIEQARMFGSQFGDDTIETTYKEKEIFISQGKHITYRSRSLILATGVTDFFPHFTNWKAYLGKSLFWCITCDGYKTRGKRIIVIGKTNEAVCTALQFLIFTRQIVFVTNTPPGKHVITKEWIRRLEKTHIPFYDTQITAIAGDNGIFSLVTLSNGQQLPLDYLFSEHEAKPNTTLAKQLGVRLSETSYILTDAEQRTNIPFVYAAGDVTKLFNHQVITAAHEGATAAQTAHYDLFPQLQQET